MSKEKAIKALREIMQQFEYSIIGATGEYPDEDAKEAYEDNKECIEALEIAIKALS